MLLNVGNSHEITNYGIFILISANIAFDSRRQKISLTNYTASIHNVTSPLENSIVSWNVTEK